MLRSSEFTKKEINVLSLIAENPSFKKDLKELLGEYSSDGVEYKEALAEVIEKKLPLHQALTVTWLVYELCNMFSDYELPGSFLSSIVVEIEDLVMELDELVEKYKEIYKNL